MDITDLITFKTVVDKRGFTKAADSLHYSQSNVTKHIKKLENEIGFELFERGWRANLTKEGELFYKKIDCLLEHWSEVCTFSNEIEAEQIGELRIGIIEPMSQQFIPIIIEWLQRYRPRMNAIFEVGNTTRLCRLIQDNDLDLAFCGENPDMSKELKFQKINQDKIVIIVPMNHELLDKKAIKLEDILNYPLILGDKTCISHQVFINALEKEDLINNLKHYYICSNQLLIPDILTNNQIGIVPNNILKKTIKEVIPLKITPEGFNIVYGAVKKRGYNHLEKTLLSIINFVITKHAL